MSPFLRAFMALNITNCMWGGGAGKRLERREKGPTETYSDMTFSYVDNHQELCFPIHEDKNVTCQSKGESPTIDQE